MDPTQIKMMLSDMRKKYDWINGRTGGHYILPKEDMDSFVRALDYILADKVEIEQVKRKEKKEKADK